MAYEVLARKWRPQQFDEVVGQEHVTRTLKNAIRTNRVAHAYLFVGPRGIGKTSIARILAKALNCAEGPTEKPCDRCPSCTEIVAGTHLDVQEIDGASNRGIDDVRALRDTIPYIPSGRYKIIIIDEVHQVTPDAFNALLKTLEEPPPHVKFIFATTEPQKIPPTILSRCQRFDLRRIPLKLLMERLALIAKTEEITIEEDALLAVARASEGGLRDAESALDQLISFQGKHISERDVLAVFGLVSREALEALVTALLKGDMAAVIRGVEALDQQGKDLQRLLLELLEYCRNLLVLLQVGDGVANLDLTSTQMEVQKTQAGLTDMDRLLRITDILTETMDRFRYALSKKTLLETALIRCARAAVTVSLDEILAQVRTLKSCLPAFGGLPARSAPAFAKSASGGEGRPAEAGASSPPRSATAERGGDQGLPATAAKDQERAGASLRSSDDTSARPSTPFPERLSVSETIRDTTGPWEKNELALLEKEWHSIVERVGKLAVLAKGYLMDARPVAIVGDQVTIGFDPEFADRIEQVGLPRNRAALQKVLSEMLHRVVVANFKVLDSLEHSGASGQTTARAVPDEVHPAEGVKAPAKSSLRGKHKWMAHESVQKTMDMFNGRIIDIKE